MLPFSVKVALNPATSLESHSCTFRISNPLRITFLRKNRGRGPQPPSFAQPRSSLSPLIDTSFLDDMRLGDWIHHPSHRLQQSHAASRAERPSTARNICHPERSEGSAFLLASITSTLAASQSPVDTSPFLPYSAPANDFASPSPPSSSRHSAALDDVCIAIRYHTVLITRWRNGPAGFLFLEPKWHRHSCLCTTSTSARCKPRSKCS